MHPRQKRVATVVEALKRRGFTTVPDLAKDLGISTRVTFRHIAQAREDGFTIDSSTGAGGGIRLNKKHMR